MNIDKNQHGKSKMKEEGDRIPSLKASNQENKKIYQPICILDLRYNKEGNDFEFIVSMSRSRKQSKMELEITNLDEVNEEYKIWLLSKFKHNLRGLSLIDRMKTWVLNRLDILKDYCELNDISFDCLHAKYNLPPSEVFTGFNYKSAKYFLDDLNIAEVNQRNNTGVKARNECLSVKERSKKDSLKFVLSKSLRLKAITNQFKIMMAKYKNADVINKQELLEELDRIRAHVYDF